MAAALIEKDGSEKEVGNLEQFRCGAPSQRDKGKLKEEKL